MDINGSTLGLTRDDGNDVNIDIVPGIIDVDGTKTATGVYHLFFSGNFDDPGDQVSAGDVCFNVEDSNDWLYDGSELSFDEQEQIVTYIQREVNR